jgi:hypothetical protein
MRYPAIVFSVCVFALSAAVAVAGTAGAVGSAQGRFAPVQYDPFVGDWLPNNAGDYVAQVISTGSNAYQANVLFAFDDESSAKPVAVLRGTRPDEKSPVELRDESGGWTGTMRPDCCGSPQMEITNSKTNEKVRLLHHMRPNPRLQVKPPEGAVVLFVERMRDRVFTLAMEDGAIVSRDMFSGARARVRVHVEFRMIGEQSAGAVRFLGAGADAGADASAGRIELRASFGRGDGVACGTMGRLAPSVRAERALLEWQALDIEASPDAWVVFLNGVKIHEIARVRLGDSPPVEKLPLKIEATGEPVEFRNIWVAP